MKQEHKKDLRLRRITRCEVGRLAGTKSSVAASACRKESLTVVQESTHSVLKQILLMRVAARPACLHREWWLQIASVPRPGECVGQIWPPWPGFRGRGQGIKEGGVCIRARDECSAVCVANVLRVRKQSCGRSSRICPVTTVSHSRLFEMAQAGAKHKAARRPGGCGRT